MNKSWNYVRLDELCDIRIGRTPRRDTSAYWGGTAVWVTISELNGGVISESREHVSNLAVKEIMQEPIPTGTLLFSFKLSIGKMGVTGCPLYTNEAIAALVIRDSNRLLRDFLKCALQAVNHEIGANTAVLGKVLNKEKVSGIQIPLPPLPEQERIVRLLDEAESLRATRERANTRMEQFVPALFQEMFGDFSKHEQVQVSEIAKVQGGLQLTPKRNDFPLRKPYLRVANVQRGYLVLDEIKEINLTEDEFTKTKLEQGDILVVEGNGNPAEIGRAAIWHNQVEDCVHQNHLIRIRCNSDRLLPDYLVIFLNSETGRKYFLKSGNTTSGLVTISTSVVKKCAIPLPPLALQREFASRVEEVRSVQSAQGKSAEKIEALYQSMLSRAFEGEL